MDAVSRGKAVPEADLPKFPRGPRWARDPQYEERAIALKTVRDRRAAELRPHDDDPWRSLASLYRKLGDREAAHEAALKVIEITTRKLEASLEDVVLLSRLAEAYARFGGKEETHAVLRRVVELDPADGLALYNCACAYALLGEEPDALLFLRRAFECGFRGVIHSVQADSAFDSFRQHPEFRKLVAELE